MHAPFGYYGGETIKAGILAHGALVLDVEYDETCVAGDWVVYDYAAMATGNYARPVVHKPGSDADNPQIAGLLLSGGADSEYGKLLVWGWIVPDADQMKSMYGPWAGIVSAKVTTSGVTAGTALQYHSTAGTATAATDTERNIGVAYATPATDLLTYMHVTCR